MNKEKKKKEIIFFKNLLSDNKTIFLINLSKLNSNQISILRKNFYFYNICMKVVKNTLLKTAIKEIKKEKFRYFIPFLKKNTSVLFSKKENGKIISNIIKNFHNKEEIEIPTLKVAYVQDSFYHGDEGLKLLINLKSKEEIIIDIINNIKYPIDKVLLSLLQTVEKIPIILEFLKKSLNKKI